jgi:Undecaprenyl-phosphate glucose phosphotransferase
MCSGKGGPVTRRSVNLFQFWLTIGYFLLPAVSFGIAAYVRFKTGLFPYAEVDRRPYWLFVALVTIVWIFIVERLGLNRISTLLALRTGIKTTAQASAYCIVLSLSPLFFYRSVNLARTFVIVGCGLLFVLGVVVIHFFRGILQTIDKSPKGHFRIAIIGSDREACRVADRLSSNHVTRCKIACFVALPGQAYYGRKGPVLEWDKLADVVDVFHCTEILICLPPEEMGQSHEILRAVQHLCIPARMVLDLGEDVFVPDRVYDYYGIPLLDIRPYPVDTIAYSLGKRLFDIVFSTLALLIGLPLILLIVLAIKLTSEGPILFTQERVSLNGSKFKMIKFRSMYIQDNRTSSEQHTSRSDQRITPIGRILRRTSLDELPQFLNVIRGDMSVVGPRPELTFFVQKFRSEIPQYMSRHNVRPGITGWAQVNGLRGSDTSIVRRVEYDLQYMRNWSMLLDLRIILMTLTKGILTSQAY